MRYLSLFSGIEAASVAWEPLGWECAGVAENEAFPSAVLAHHWPDAPNLGDVTKITDDDIAGLGRIDLIVGGFPCQDVSVAGQRKGLRNEDGSATRSGLFFEAMRLVRCARERCGLRWLIIENVPGLYSSHRGRDFAAVVGEMVGCRFSVPREGWRNCGAAAGPDGMVEWASLDAQFFGLAQRRKRVFLVADFGDWRDRPPILLEPESLRGNPAPSRETGQRVAASLTRGADSGGKGGYAGRRREDDIEVAAALGAHGGPHGRQDFESETSVATTAPTVTSNPYGDHEAREGLLIAHYLRAEGFDASEDGSGRGTPLVPVHAFDARQQDVIQYGDRAGPLDTDGTSQAVMTLAVRGRDGAPNLEVRDDGLANAVLTPNGGRSGIGVGAVAAFTVTATANGLAWERDVAPTVGAHPHSETSGRQTGVRVGSAVRRLTPLECCRLQGFPDDFLSQVTYRGKPPSDGAMYRALGNSMAVPCMAWLGGRIAQVWRPENA